MRLNDLKKSAGISILLFIIIQIAALISITIFKGGRILWLSLVWMLLTIPIYLLTKQKRTTIIYILINSLVAGMTISGYYLYKEIEIYNILTVTLCYVGILIMNYLVMYWLQLKRTANLIFTILSALGLIFGTYQWTEGNLSLGSCIVFTSIVILCMNISFLYYLNQKRVYDFLEAIKLSSLLMFGSIFFVVITAITDGESLNVFDSPWENGKKKSTTKL